MTHELGVLASIAGLIMLLLRAAGPGNIWMLTGFTIYGISLIFLYLSSTLYHTVSDPSLKSVFRIIDHVAIYVFIAGTYAPFTLVSLRGSWGWALFGTIWTLAFVGILFNIFSSQYLTKLETTIYILMGWLSLVALPKLVATISLGGTLLLILGGFIYTLGTASYVRKSLPYNHAIWHLFVLGGTACHYFAVYFFVAPN